MLLLKANQGKVLAVQLAHREWYRFCRHPLRLFQTLRRSSHLQGTGSDTQALGGPLQIPTGFIHCHADRSLFNTPANGFESYATVQGNTNSTLETGIAPFIPALCPNRSIVRRDATHGNRSLAGVAAEHARHNLFEIPHIAGVFSAQQVFLNRIVQNGWRPICAQLFKKMACQGENVFRAFPQRGQFAYITGDPVIEVGTECAALNLLPEIAVGGTYQPKRSTVPGIAADAFERMLLNDAQQLGLQT